MRRGRDDEENPSILSTATLLVQARGGDTPAREELAGRYRTMLCRWAHGRIPGAARDLVDTEDIVQSTIMRAFKNLNSFDNRGEGAFLGYLREILMNRIRDEARRAGRRPQHVALDPEMDATRSPTPLDEAIGRERMDRYDNAMTQLGETQREAIVLRLEMGMRYRDIAEALGLPTAEAARALIGRGMARLARLMRDHHE